MGALFSVNTDFLSSSNRVDQERALDIQSDLDQHFTNNFRRSRHAEQNSEVLKLKMSANEDTKPTGDPPDESGEISVSSQSKFEAATSLEETPMAEILTDSKNKDIPLANGEFQKRQYTAEKYMEEGHLGQDDIDLQNEQAETKIELGKKRKSRIDLENGAKRRSRKYLYNLQFTVI